MKTIKYKGQVYIKAALPPHLIEDPDPPWVVNLPDHDLLILRAGSAASAKKRVKQIATWLTQGQRARRLPPSARSLYNKIEKITRYREEDHPEIEPGTDEG